MRDTPRLSKNKIMKLNIVFVIKYFLEEWLDVIILMYYILYKKQCEKEWFHFSCVGITQQPKGKWYCKDCTSLKKKELLKF